MTSPEKYLGPIQGFAVRYESDVENPEVVDDKEISFDDFGEGFHREFHISNSIYDIILSYSGEVTSILDKRCAPPRQVLRAGERGNKMMIFDDIPFYWDAWDVMPYHAMTGKRISIDSQGTVLSDSLFTYSVDDSKLPEELRIEFQYNKFSKDAMQCTSSDSCHKLSYGMTYIIRVGDPLIECTLRCHWHESHRLLKTEWPLNVRTSHAKYDSQHGFVERPTHRNNDTDAAKYEVCGHKYADLSEEGYGVALINDSKYGYSALGSVLSLSLLRAPKSPDPQCDMGYHEIRYALLPHLAETVGIASAEERTSGLQDVVRSAIRFNCPIQSVEAPIMSTEKTVLLPLLENPLFSVKSTDHVKCCSLILDAIKMSEIFLSAIKCCDNNSMTFNRDNEAVILRLYESVGSSGTAEIVSSCGLLMKEVVLCNLNENMQELVGVNIEKFTLPFSPFKIYTLRIKFK